MVLVLSAPVSGTTLWTPLISLGRLVDKTYRQTAQKLQDQGLSRGRDSAEFPLERTRLRGIYLLIAITTLGTVGYGLALMTKTVSVRARVLGGDFVRTLQVP